MNEIAVERLVKLLKKKESLAWFANDEHLDRTVEYLVSNGVVANSTTRRVMSERISSWRELL